MPLPYDNCDTLQHHHNEMDKVSVTYAKRLFSEPRQPPVSREKCIFALTGW